MLQRLKSCFSAEEVNCGRQFEFDVVKTLLIFFMVTSHVIFYLTTEPYSLVTDILYNLLAGVYCAPGFMICMGIGAVYTNKNRPADFLRRGIKLLAVGFLLPILSFGLIPLLLSEPIDFPVVCDCILSVDIMHFAGLAFLLIGFLKMAKLTNRQILMVAIVMDCLSTAFNFTEFDYPVPSVLLNFFFLSDGRSYFPLFGWFVFPAFGLVFGELWKHCNDKKKFYLSVSPIAFGIGTTYMVASYVLKIGPGLGGFDYYGMPVWDALMCLVLFIGIFGMAYLTTLPITGGGQAIYYTYQQQPQQYLLHSLCNAGIYYGCRLSLGN